MITTMLFFALILVLLAINIGQQRTNNQLRLDNQLLYMTNHRLEWDNEVVRRELRLTQIEHGVKPTCPRARKVTPRAARHVH